MQTKVQRSVDTLVGFAVPSSATGNGIDFSSYSSGGMRCPSATANGLTTLTWYSGDNIAGPWFACTDISAQSLASGQSAQIPVATFGYRFLLPVGNATSVLNIDLKA